MFIDTTIKAEDSKAELQTIDAVRAYTAGALEGFNTNRLNRYEAGYQQSLEEFGRLLDPAGYSRDRSRPALISSLQNAPIAKSRATLQSVQAVRDYLDRFFASALKDPSDNRYLYAYEDANWRLWSLVDPMGYETAIGYLPQ